MLANLLAWFDLRPVNRKLDRLIADLNEWRTEMSLELDALAVAVKRTTDIEESAITLIKGVADQIKANAADAAAMAQLAIDLNAKADALAAAVAESTPAPVV